tara:strand:- start:3691 stop:4467 length:777 start_codon:yes stop_codon:yes gene_type:complete
LRKRRTRVPPKPTPPQPRINERVRVPSVRVIDDQGHQVGVLSTDEALGMARERNVDMVEVSPNADPPVVRLMDFGRFKFEQSKKDREARKHQQKVQIREVRMKPKIEDHDIDFKTRTIQKLLRQGDKVKITVMFRGREITHPQLGKSLLEKVFDNLEGHGTLEKDASLEGRRMSIVVAPDKRGIAAYKRAQETKAVTEGAVATADLAENLSSEEVTNQHDDSADEVNVASDNAVEDDSGDEVVDSSDEESAEESGDSE